MMIKCFYTDMQKNTWNRHKQLPRPLLLKRCSVNVEYLKNTCERVQILVKLQAELFHRYFSNTYTMDSFSIIIECLYEMFMFMFLFRFYMKVFDFIKSDVV